MTKIISPQLILVDEIPHHIKDLPPRYCVIMLEVDSAFTTSSERRAESLLQDSGEDSEPESAPTEETEAGSPPTCLYKEVKDESTHSQTAIFGILRSVGSVAREIMHAAAQSRDREMGDWED